MCVESISYCNRPSGDRIHRNFEASKPKTLASYAHRYRSGLSSLSTMCGEVEIRVCPRSVREGRTQTHPPKAVNGQQLSHGR